MWKNAFKAYDIRGKIPSELNEALIYKIGQSTIRLLEDMQTVIIGYDAREDSHSFAKTLEQSFLDGGCDVINLGLCGTEQVYFYTGHLGSDAGLMVTASHNPKDYNGIKIVQKNAAPLSGKVSLNKLKNYVEDYQSISARQKGNARIIEDKTDYIQHLLSYIDISKLKPLTIVTNAGNGTAGLIIDRLEAYLPCKFIKIQNNPNSSFPYGIPNPLLPKNRKYTAEAVKTSKADFGIAWDGDYDRCFFFDHKGHFIEGYYIVGLLAQALLEKNKGGNIIYDPRLTWNSIDMITKAGGNPIISQTGHALIKQKMRATGAIYGGEMSAHHYFNNFYYCDSGMIPWLLIYYLLSTQNKNLKELTQAAQNQYPCSGEKNYNVNSPKSVISAIKNHFMDEPTLMAMHHLDGLSMEFKDWRFNLRSSNTEALLRLNIEAKNSPSLMQEKTNLCESLIKFYQ